MTKLNIPLLLSPVFKPKIWGRRDLAPIYDRAQHPGGRGAWRARLSGPGLGEDTLIGEAWITDDASRFRSGPPAGLALAEAVRQYGPELCGKSWKEERFPILAKYIFTGDWLSVQVHPDDAYARVHDPGSAGKCEMWYIVQAERGAEILLGLKPGTSKEKFKAALEKGKAKDLLQSFHPRPGEAIFVPPGTVHALGPGLVLFEAEENSDLTYRLDDFGRVGLDGKPRPLHWEKGLEVTRADLPAFRGLPRLEFREPYGSRRYVVASRFFAVEKLSVNKTAGFEGPARRVETLSILEGDGRIETAAGWMSYRTGDAWLVPPATAAYRLVPRRRTRVLKFYIPDLEKEFRRPLLRRGVRPAEIKKIVFD